MSRGPNSHIAVLSEMRRARDLRVATGALVCVIALASVSGTAALSDCVKKTNGDYLGCEDLADGVSQGPYVTSKSDYKLFSFELPANTDATLTLEVNAGDGDADLYVYGPKYASGESLPGPSNYEWRSHHAVGDDVVHISRYDEGGNPAGRYKVGVWGWSIRSAPNSVGTTWKLTLNLQSSEVNNTASQKAAMKLVYDKCCTASGGDSPGSNNAATSGPDSDSSTIRCSAWEEKGKDGTDFCHMRGSLCNSAGELTHLHLAGFGLSCEFPVADLAPVLRTVHRLDISSNPDLEGGTSAANTLMALSATVAPNMTHFHASYSPVFRSASRLTFTPRVCSVLPPNLISVRISQTEATGTIPGCMIQTHLRELEMSSNALSGQMPGPYDANASNPSDIEVMLADNCEFTGTIPSEWADHAPRLNVFSAANNELTGSIPAFMEETLEMIRLPGNLLTGGIPNSLASLPSLRVLEFQDNQLTGSIPEGLFSGSNLLWAFLHDNALTGTMPDQSAYGAKLLVLNVQNNALEGNPLPNVLLDAPALYSYKAGGNLFSAKLPAVTEYDETTEAHKLTKLKELRILDLSDNKMYGPAPAEYEQLVIITPGEKGFLCYADANGRCTEPLVHVLDLSSNELSGQVPAWAMQTKWGALIEINITDNNWACPIPESIDIDGLTCVDGDGVRRDRFDGVVIGDGTTNYREEPRKKSSGFFGGADSMGWSVVVLILIIVVVVWTMAVIRNYVKRKLYPRDEGNFEEIEENFSGPMANMDGLELTDVGPPRPQEGANRPRMTSRGMPLFND